MPATLDSLPEELLQLVSNAIMESSRYEVGLHRGIFSHGNAAYEIERPESSVVTLHSLRLVSRSWYGFASETLQKCKPYCLSINFFHTRDHLARAILTTGPGNHDPFFGQVTVPGNFVPDTFFADFSNLQITIPLHFGRGMGSSERPIYDVLMSCTMNFSRAQNRIWSCDLITVHKINDCEGWNFTPESIAAAIILVKQRLPMLACAGLNDVNPIHGVQNLFGPAVTAQNTAPDGASPLSCDLLIRALTDHIYRLGMGPDGVEVKSRRGRLWRVIPALNRQFELDHKILTHYTDYIEATPLLTNWWRGGLYRR